MVPCGFYGMRAFYPMQKMKVVLQINSALKDPKVVLHITPPFF